MKDQVHIRPEAFADAEVISQVTEIAFRTMEISNHTEQLIIEALRAAGALAVSLVAELDGNIVGHIAFSPVTMSDGTPDWFVLGPVSVLPEYQRQRIGTSLIERGLSHLKELNARGCCTVGHPEYYGRFGFVNTAELGIEGVPPEAFFALPFDGPIPHGTVQFHEAFKVDGL